MKFWIELFLAVVYGIMWLTQRRISLIIVGILTLTSLIRANIPVPAHVENVFDEMIEKNYGPMEGAERIWAEGYEFLRLTCPIAGEPDMEIGLIYSREYKKLYLYGEAEQTEGETRPYQEYFEDCLKERGISLGELEDQKEEFLCRDILGNWFEEYDSNYTKDRLGNLEVIDYLMPYEYAGTDNEDKKEKVTVEEDGYDGLFAGKVTYTTWSAPDGVQCIQQSREYGYQNVFQRIADDMNGKLTNGEIFSIIIIHDGWERQYRIGSFIDREDMEEWIRQEPDKVYGNLAGPAYSREEGEEKTRKMLRALPERGIQSILERCEFYMDDEYLYMRFPCHTGKSGEGSYKTKSGWIAVRWEDMPEDVRQKISLD